jgi:hypothetical protein
MLEIKPDNEHIRKKIKELMIEIEKQCESKFFCFYQDQSGGEQIDRGTVLKIRKALQELGTVEKLSILVDSPGGHADDAFHLVRALRQHANYIEVLVVDWAKSGATFVCLGADKIIMGENGELGPLDVQIRELTGSMKPKSAIDVFQTLEYLREYSITTLDIATLLFIQKGSMDIPYAIEKALSFVTCIINPLYNKVNPLELGEARRLLSVGKEYCKRIMKRYSYSLLSDDNIESIAQRLVFEYPSHSFVIDLEEAKEIGLNVEALDSKRTNLCEELISSVNGCIGFVTENNNSNLNPNPNNSK